MMSANVVSEGGVWIPASASSLENDTNCENKRLPEIFLMFGSIYLSLFFYGNVIDGGTITPRL